MKTLKPLITAVYWAVFAFFIIKTTACTMTKAYKKDPKAVGEVVPCSARVGKKITDNIKADHSPKVIVEVGAGDGALTPKILEKMTDLDHLDLVEIEPILCEELTKKFGHLKNVSIHCMDFLQFKPGYQYDYMVSTLPFNSFPPELTQKLIDHLIALAKNGAPLSFVEFKWLSSIRTLGMSKAEKAIHQKNRDIIEGFYKKYQLYDVDVYMNFPPIIVYHVKIVK